jgi:hypothetical protein
MVWYGIVEQLQKNIVILNTMHAVLQ